VFDSEERADAAIHSLRVPPSQFNAVVHGEHVREEDIQLGGTLALRGAVLGGLLVGVLGMLGAVLLIWPEHGWHNAWGAGLLMGFAGSILGVIAGAVAGASDCKPTIRDEAKFAEKRHKRMVTCELDHNSDAAETIRIFEEQGGRHVHAA
jgi:hypothetical protein